MNVITPLAESDLFLQKMTIQTKNPPKLTEFKSRLPHVKAVLEKYNN